MKEFFPILGTTETIPWVIIGWHEDQAQKNHYQRLERLAERGGLSWSEALAVLEDRPWIRMDELTAKQEVLKITSKKCATCGAPLIWGGFAYNQDTCWECFKIEVQAMQDRIDAYPSWLWDKREKHKEILHWTTSVVAERFGKDW